ncbi:MAG: TetR/AcrR family transcriptional regulator [Gemmatimonadales bacterium]
MDRILAAAEELIARGVFDRATISGLVKRADTSVGAFYSRFRDKKALESVIQERFVGRIEAEVAKLTDSARWLGQPFVTVVHGVVTGLVDLLRRERGGFRSLVCGSIGVGRSAAARARRIDQAIGQGVEGLFQGFAGEIIHPRPAVAVRIGLTMVVGAARERFAYGADDLLPERLDSGDLVAELAAAYLAYLQGSVAIPTASVAGSDPSTPQ